jgi:hypothetical protein
MVCVSSSPLQALTPETIVSNASRGRGICKRSKAASDHESEGTHDDSKRWFAVFQLTSLLLKEGVRTTFEHTLAVARPDFIE